jgi:RNA polymerase sigma factor (sigma-70 family)
MEASALQAPAGLARSRLSIGYPLLRLRSDEQLVALFRGGNEEAFRVIHDRYHQRLFAYARQMLPGSRQDAEDALQDIFVRAYSGLRASNGQLALRAWLYRVAHNRCIDEMRRPPPPSGEIMEIIRPPSHDPIAVAERRESLRRLIDDVRRLPDQQRSALLMRELGGIPYADLAAALGVSVPAVKSLLVRARIGLAHAMEAREVACHEIREELAGAHDRGVRPSGIARRHMHDCVGCKEFRGQIRGTSRGLAALLPFGPLALLGKVFGFGIGGGAAGSGAAGSGAAGGGAAAAGGVAGTTGAVATIGVVATGAATHVATLIAAAAVVTAGGAVEIQHTISSAHTVAHHAAYQTASGAAPSAARVSSGSSSATTATPALSAPTATSATPPQAPPNASSATSDATAGPLIPSADQLNPADAAANAASGTTGAGTTGAGSTGAGDGTTGAGTGTTGAQGTGTTGTGDGGTGGGTPTTGPGTTRAGGGTTGPGTGTTPTGITGTGKGTPGTGTTTTGSGTGTPPTFSLNDGGGTQSGADAGASSGSAGAP